MAGILHIVGYGQIEGVTAAKVERVRQAIETLVADVDGAELLAIGPNISQSRFAQDWHYSAIVRLRDRATLTAYLAHQSHAALSAEAGDGFYERCAVLDIEIGSPTTQGDMP